MLKNKNKKKLSRDGSNYTTDEKINTISHLSALIFSILGSTLLIIQSSIMGDAWKIVSFSLYSLGIISLFLSSVLMHGLTANEKTIKVFRTLDYCSIFLFISGTFAPLCLVVIDKAIGIGIISVIALVSIIGISLRASIQSLEKWITNTFYVSLGWIGVVVAFMTINKLPLTALALLAIGGILYTAGSFIFYHEKPNILPEKFGFHEIWHLFVIGGAVCHFFMMYFYILPY